MNPMLKKIHSTFQQHIEGWKDVSPLDPTYQLAEAMAASFEMLESSSQDFHERMISCLPTFMGVHPKKSELAQYWLEVSLKNKNDFINIQQGKILPIKRAGLNDLHLICDKTYLSPFVVSAQTDNKVTMTSNETLNLQNRFVDLIYLPIMTGREVNTLKSIHLCHDGEIQTLNVSENKVKIQDLTHGLTQEGRIRFHFPGDLPCLADGIELEFNLELNTSGHLATNLIKVALSEIKTNHKIATLKGSHWEEIELPKDLYLTPSKLTLSKLSGDKLDLNLAQDNALKAVNEGDQSIYLHNGLRNGLIFPYSLELLENETGHAGLYAKHALFICREDLSDNKFSIEDHELKRMLSSHKIIKAIRSVQPRESIADFSERFHHSLKDFLRPSHSDLFDEKDLKANLMSKFMYLKSVDVEFIEGLNKVKIYAATGKVKNELIDLNKVQEKEIYEYLKDYLPLNLSISINSFKRDYLYLGVQVSHQELVSDSDFKASLTDDLESMVNPRPYGHDQELLDTTGLLQESFHEIKNSKLRNHHNVYLKQFKRESGKYYNARIEVYHNESKTEQVKPHSLPLHQDGAGQMDGIEGALDVFL